MAQTFQKTLYQKWQQFSLIEQMANIGSEINRAILWKEEDDTERAESSAERALELIDLTTADKRWRSKLREPLLLREVFCDYCFSLSNYDVSAQQLKSYFLPFALMANKDVR